MDDKDLMNNGGSEPVQESKETGSAEQAVLVTEVVTEETEQMEEEIPVATGEVLPKSEDGGDGRRKDKPKSAAFYRHLPRICRVLSGLCRGLLYASAVAVALLLIIGLLLAVVQIPVEEMLPFCMRAVKEGETVTDYRLALGNGVGLLIDAENVSIGDIKSVHYWNFAMAVVSLLTAAPILFFVGGFLGRVAENREITERETRLITFTGLTVMLGGTILYFVELSSQWNLVNRFISDTAVWAPSLRGSLSGVFLGLVIILFGRLIGYRSLKDDEE